MDSEPHERLIAARRAAGYASAEAAAAAMGIRPPTYHHHENGGRSFRRVATRYAQFYRVSLEWLLTGKGPMKSTRNSVPVMGAIIAGGIVSFDSSTHAEAPLPPDATEKAVAYCVRGVIMPGIFEDGWLIYTTAERAPPDDRSVGPLCVIGLDDDTAVLGRLLAANANGTFDLMTLGFELRRSQAIAWIARVLWIKPAA